VQHRIELEPFGDAAMRARLPEGVDARSLLRTLRGLPGVSDAVVTERHALVTFAPSRVPEGIVEAIEGSLGSPALADTSRPVAIAVRYDGEDLREVADAAGLTPEELIALHAGAEYTVAAIGFMPGFAYLRGLHPRLVVPRRATPRARVPALSVAIAGPYAGVYPFASPGGWHLLGTAVGFAPFDASSGARLALGDRVRFAPVDGQAEKAAR
jgi:5-oxoprolinase (ATP-hydrolysing) subunit A